MTPEKWDEHWQFIFGGQKWIDEPRYQVFRDMVMNHLVHHRAQLGVYLRLLDKPIPERMGLLRTRCEKTGLSFQCSVVSDWLRQLSCFTRNC